jgi:hypothetical protein
MPFLKKIKVKTICPECKTEYVNYTDKPHACNTARDQDKDPENRPEMQHQSDLKAAQIRRYKRSRDDELKR